MRDAVEAIWEAARAGVLRQGPENDFGYDSVFVERTLPLVEFFYSNYFRVRLAGIENVPAQGPAILVANHSGGIPYDGVMLVHAVRAHHAAHRRLRPLVATFAFRSGWMSQLVGRFGGVRASMDNALALLAQNDLLGVFPEGLKGVGKPFRERYRLHSFGRGGYLRLAQRAQVPVIPVAIVGAEEIHPVIGKLTTLAEPLGIPYIPITPTFPWLGPLGLLPVPSKWTIVLGPPMTPPAPDATADALGAMADSVRNQIDEMIADVLVHRRSVLFG